jgi:prepilin-type N-terminal cleavage/methylation domain-containing protein
MKMLTIKTQRKSTMKGFSLIELLVVVVIIGVLMTIGTPLYSGYQRSAKCSASKANFGSAVNFVRTQLTNAELGQAVSAAAVASLNSGDKKNPWTPANSAFTVGDSAASVLADDGSTFVSVDDLSGVASGGNVVVTVDDPNNSCGWTGNQIAVTLTRD